MLINVKTACDLIPELLLTVASAEFPAGSALVWSFFKLDVWIVFSYQWCTVATQTHTCLNACGQSEMTSPISTTAHHK